jgi:hypothetical protein
MFNSRVFTLVLMLLVCLLPFTAQSETATYSSTIAGPMAQNKFVGRWSSQITTSSGEVFDDGVLEISDTSEPSADKVRVLHSVRGGPVIGYTLSYPDRIEIQLSLGDGRVAHYNGVLVSASRIEGRYFVTGKPQSQHTGVRLLVDEDGTWVAQAGAG